MEFNISQEFHPRKTADPHLCQPSDDQSALYSSELLLLQVSGETLDELLSDGRGKTLYAVLLHASWCPFSRAARPAFDALGAMFPQIRHLAVEESSAMPRFGSAACCSRSLLLCSD